MTTTSPTFSVSTSAPTASTIPIASWPMRPGLAPLAQAVPAKSAAPRYGRGWRKRAVQAADSAGGRAGAMLHTRRNPDHVTGPNLFDRASPTLRAATARRHDQRLTEGVRVPCRPGAGLERDAGARHARWIRGLEQRVDPYSAGKPLSRSSAGGL